MALLSTPFDAYQSTPPATRTIIVLILVASIAYQYLSYSFSKASSGHVPDTDFAYLVLVPGSWMWYPWTIITSALVETSIIQAVFTLLFIAPSLRYLERLWGTLETVKFVLVTCGVSNVISIVINYVEYLVIGRPELFLYGMYYSGMMALQAGCLVAFTQLIPEHQVQLFGVLKMRVKQLPMLYVGFSNIMCVLGFQTPYILIQWGWLVSWVYLRFYKRTSIEGVALSGAAETWGDRSDTFAFVNWFPPFVHGPLGKVCDFVYNAAVRVKLVKPYPLADVESGTYVPLGSSVNARAEAERRRAMALKALDQRMAASANVSTSKNPRPPVPSAAPAGESSAGPSDSSLGPSDAPAPDEK